jgi:hypothetical protein
VRVFVSAVLAVTLFATGLVVAACSAKHEAKPDRSTRSSSGSSGPSFTAGGTTYSVTGRHVIAESDDGTETTETLTQVERRCRLAPPSTADPCL